MYMWSDVQVVILVTNLLLRYLFSPLLLLLLLATRYHFYPVAINTAYEVFI